MTISGTTICYPLIGHPVAQVRTPPAINAWFSAQGVDAAMFPADIVPAAVEAFFASLRGWGNCGGCSVTVPHKQAAFHAMDEVTARARQVGAVNIVRRRPDGRLSGDMTDGLAFVAALQTKGIKLKGASVLLAGAGGGAGLAIAAALAEAGVAGLTLLEPDAARRAKAAALLAGTFPALSLAKHEAGFDLAVNASPLGMRPDDPLPFDPAWLCSGGIVADVVTKPVMTPLLQRAAESGLTIQTGNDMADAQLPFQMRHLGLWSGDSASAEVASL
ncbi:shikimate dehydrogenase family protein [Pelagibius marinus]|uniref:shikimate dehydrogenase family protein n=1 Tax=Pelagibius marinus TaxID=2762760 RepID=UPI001872A2B6|nr:shikimate dehydrogenase [Pelagibius marinus]